MAYPSQVLTNPVTGERITFLETTESTQGERLLFDCRVAPHHNPLPPHVHATQDEHLQVLAGTVGVLLGDDEVTLEAGQDITLPTGVKHQWWNAGGDELRMRVEVVPPRRLEGVLEAVSGMAHKGKLRANGMPRNPFLLAHLLRLSETFTPGLPIWPQKAALAIASFIGRLLTFDPALADYRPQPNTLVELGLESVMTVTDQHDTA